MKFSALRLKIPQLVYTPVVTESDKRVKAHYSLADRLAASVSYIYFISPAVILFRTSNSEFVKFHAKHALILLVLTLFFLILPWWVKYLFIVPLLLLNLTGLVLAFMGRTYFIPGITKLVTEFVI